LRTNRSKTGTEQDCGQPFVGATACHTAGMPQRYLSLADVAEILGVSVGQVRSMVSSGELEGFQLGGRRIWRVGTDDLDAYVQQAKARTRERISSGAGFDEDDED